MGIDLDTALNRRTFLSRSGVGLGSIALSTMAGQPLAANAGDRVTVQGDVVGVEQSLPNLAPRVKRVIFLCMAGGPSHLETFDYKPELARLDGQPMPESFTAGQPIAQLQGQKLKVQGPLTQFKRYGEQGQTVSDFLPWHSRMVDDICVVKSMVTEQINHDPAHTFMNTGSAINGRPSMGSWITYGLGSEADDLPGFIVMTSVGGRNPQPISSRQWDCGFLPGKYQGVEFNSTGDAVHYVNNPAGVSRSQQRRLIHSLNELNALQLTESADPGGVTRMAQYELAFRMQASVPELMDVSDEPQSVLDMYGAQPGDGSFASNCLLARRLAERGVRFIQLYHRGWDHHGDLVKHMNTCCRLTDKPTWALLNDLKQRGMLDDTLLIWGGEFGRTPMFQGKGGPGRDHHIKGFSMWLAGGGIRPGSYGATDELGYNAVENVVHVRDLHATILQMLGIEHRTFSVKHQGLDMRLTGVEQARVIREILG